MAKDFNNQQVVEGYDQHIRKLIPGYELIHLQVHAILTAYLNPQAEILVVGCGTGYELQYLAERFPQWRFTAIDPAINMLEKAQQHIQQLGLEQNITFVHGDTSVLAQIDKKFDAALAILVSHFVAYEHKANFFQEIAQSLTPNGLCISYDLMQLGNAKQAQVLKQMVQLTGLAEAQADAMLARLENDFFLMDLLAFKQVLLQSGFNQVEQFSQVLSYTGLIAFKAID